MIEEKAPPIETEESSLTGDVDRFVLHEAAEELSDETSHYKLARAHVKGRERLRAQLERVRSMREAKETGDNSCSAQVSALLAEVEAGLKQALHDLDDTKPVCGIIEELS